jgi:hypothetical protein
VKEWGKTFQANVQAGIATLISDKENFRLELVRSDNEVTSY